MKVCIIDCGSGNLRSVEKAFERAAFEAGIRAEIKVSNDPQTVLAADRLVLPGVGAFAACMAGLNAVAGLRPALEKTVLTQKRPFLGICVGMQILADIGEEFETIEGLGWLGGVVRKITPSDPNLKIPHMGWASITPTRPHPCLLGGVDFYFVHSYAFDLIDSAHLLATVTHGEPLTAAIGCGNILGVQFHPEKSQTAGLLLIKRFLNWEPL